MEYIVKAMHAYLINFLTQTATASSLLFIPIFAKEVGASDIEVGLISSAYSFATFLASNFFGRLADFHDRKKIILVGLLLSAIFFLAQVLVETPQQLLIVRTLLGFSLGIFPAALTSWVYEKSGNIGRFSAFGSLGWAIGQLLAGIIMIYWGIFVLGSIFVFLAFLIAIRENINGSTLKKAKSPLRLVKDNLSVYFSFFLRHTGAGAVWLVFPIYLSELGISKFWIGVIYFTNSFLQFLIMPRVERFNPKFLMNIGTIFSAVTFYLYSVATHVVEFLFVQLIIAVSWSAMYIGALRLVLDKNLEKNSVTGFLNSTINLSTILGSLVGGLIAEMFGYKACFYFGTIFSLLAMLIRVKSK
ncbi:MAG: MFS transporter [Archaeoglobales archaeon]|nr:MFS transporter [Archaeoglobales archaeon]